MKLVLAPNRRKNGFWQHCTSCIALKTTNGCRHHPKQMSGSYVGGVRFMNSFSRRPLLFFFLYLLYCYYRMHIHRFSGTPAEEYAALVKAAAAAPVAPGDGPVSVCTVDVSLEIPPSVTHLPYPLKQTIANYRPAAVASGACSAADGMLYVDWVARTVANSASPGSVANVTATWSRGQSAPCVNV
jgi:hypothetical protein